MQYNVMVTPRPLTELDHIASAQLLPRRTVAAPFGCPSAGRHSPVSLNLQNVAGRWLTGFQVGRITEAFVSFKSAGVPVAWETLSRLFVACSAGITL